MDIGPITRPTPLPAPAQSRPEPQPVREAVPVQLPPAKAVTAATESQAAKVELSKSARALSEVQEPAEDVRRQITTDGDTKELVYRETNTKTGEVVQQIPDEAILRLRAYVAASQALQGAASTGTDQGHVTKSA